MGVVDELTLSPATLYVDDFNAGERGLAML